MSTTSIGKISFLKRSINVAVYQDVLDHFLIPYIEDNEFILQPDLASPRSEIYKKKKKKGSERKGHLFLIGLQMAQMQIQEKIYEESSRGD